MDDVKTRSEAGQRPKPRRRGDARGRIAEAAFRLFAANGYAGTTLEAIAAEAGVAVQTVYFTFHTKADVLIAALKTGGGGAEPTENVIARSWVQDVVAAGNGAQRLALAIDHGTEIYRRLGGFFRAVSAAASVDPDVERAWQTVVTGRREGMRQITRLMASRNELRDGVDSDLAADLLFAIHRHEVFLAFTVECGWSVERYKAWTYATLCRQLLPDAVARTAVSPDAPAVADRSFRAALGTLGL